jgi:peptide/nickel transport system substrate-binding protein
MPGRAPSLWRGAALLALVLSGLLPTGCGRGEPSGLPEGKGGGGVFRVVLPSEPRTLDPNSARDEIALLLAPNLYNRLVALDLDSQLLPDLAESWEIGDAGRVYTFRLGEGIRWHDGEPFTAEDVRWTLESLAGRRSLAAEAIRRIAGIETPDARTVVIRLTEPWAPFLTTLAWNGAFILPRHLAGADPSSPSWKPVGTGPFKLGTWVRGRSLTLETNRSYFKPGPALDRVTYRFEPDSSAGPALLTSGAADYVIVRPELDRLPGLARDPQLRVLTSPGEGRSYLAFNLRRSPFADRRVREAINRALDRPALVERALHGYGAPGYGFYTPAVPWAYNPRAVAPGFSPGRARELLDEAGLVPDRRGIRFEPRLLTPDLAAQVEIGREVRRQLLEVGIAVHLEVLPPSQWIERILQLRDFELTLMGGNHGPDPENLNVRFGSRGSLQLMGYASPELDAALAEAARTPDLPRRALAYGRAQEILARDLPIAPLAEMVQVTVCRKGVTGLPQVEARGLVPLYDFSLVRVDGPQEGPR